MLADLPTILYWWLLFFGLGVVFFPLTSHFFAKFFDQGYALSKIVGMVFLSYLVWLLGSLRLVPFLSEAVWLAVIGFIFFNWFVLKTKPLKNWPIFLAEEAVFLLALILWSFVRGFQPSIHGLEKYMDYGFINSLLRTRFFPPQDMWMVGKTINYYYFGHLVAAVLTKLSGLDSALTYNLMIATIFGLCLVAGFSLAANLIFSLKRSLRLSLGAGVISSLFLTLGGNLHLFWYWLKNKATTGYWYPDATRFIVQKFGAEDNTIHEFPIYSFVVADLHGHLSNLPFVLLFLSLMLVNFTQKKTALANHLFASLLIAVFYMTNAWDCFIYLLVFGLLVLWKNYSQHGFSQKTFWQTAQACFLVVLAALIFSLPFHLRFQNIAQGLGLVDFHSPYWMLLVLWGFPLFIILSFLCFFFFNKNKKTVTDAFVLVLLLVAWLLVLLPEIIYVKDIYIHSYQRANTMFKFTYQSFVMFSLSTGYIIIRLFSGIKQNLIKACFSLLSLALAIFILTYPWLATQSYYGLKNYQGLDGLTYLNNLYPDDYQAILWLKKTINGQPVILEAVGESYTNYARVSANTGLPTVVGWPVHEWLWRGSYDQVGQYREEVRKIYELTDLGITRGLLKKHQVGYLFLGALEKEQYPNLAAEKFDQLGEVVFQSGQTKILKLKLSP